MTHDLENQQGRVEGRGAVLEKGQDDLRIGMNRVKSDMQEKAKAHEKSMEAIRETQSDHTRRLTRIEDRMGTVENRLGTVEDSLGTVEGTLVDVRIGVHAILDLLDTHLARKPRWPSLTGLLKQPRMGSEVGGDS